MREPMSRLKRIAVEAIDELLGNVHSNGEFRYTTEIMDIRCAPPPEDVVDAVTKNTAPARLDDTSIDPKSIICIETIDIDSDYLRYGLFKELIQGLSCSKKISYICLNTANHEKYLRRMSASPELTLIDSYRLFGFPIKLSDHVLYTFTDHELIGT